MLKNYGIAVEDPRLKPEIMEYSHGSSISEEKKLEVQVKIQKFFNRLYRMIEKNKDKLTLKKVFNDFDKAKKGYLNYS